MAADDADPREVDASPSDEQGGHAADDETPRGSPPHKGADRSDERDLIMWAEPPLWDVYRTARWLIRLVAAGLVLFFGYLQLSGADYATIASSLPATTTFRLALALYYTSWITGVLYDTAIQEGTYSTPPNHGRIPVILGTLALAITFGALCVWADNPVRFAGLLSGFLILNIALWRLMVDRVLPKTVAESQDAFRGDYAKLERLRLAYRVYLCGRWQWARFATVGLGLVGINILVRAGVSDLLVAGAILVLIVFKEAWIWLVRLQVGAAVRLLDRLGQNYSLTPNVQSQKVSPTIER